ncbi:MAG: hypothetical protein LC745_05930, partial [Planctomycetia bacterium]|nr:hypothetical protein [Planctomycetia bacterium]
MSVGDSTNGAGPVLAVAQGSPTVTPGTVAIAWDQTFQGTGTPPATDSLLSNRLTDGAVTAGFDALGTPVRLNDAGAGANGAPDNPAFSDVPVDVSITDPRFVTASNLTVTLGMINSSLSDVSLQLIPPPSSGLAPITLVQNQVDAANTNLGRGLTGANLGITTNGPSFGTTFDDNAIRKITDGGATAPYVGHFRPEVGSLNAAVRGATAAQLSGRWNLRVFDFRNDGGTPPPVNLVSFLNLSFTSKLTTVAGSASTIGNSVRGTLNQTGFPTTSAANPKGIGPGLSIAFDNTSGAYSPFEGRLYATYVGRLFNNNNVPYTDNTFIALSTSDNGGQGWSGGGRQVNDDNALRDGYSEGSISAEQPDLSDPRADRPK